MTRENSQEAVCTVCGFTEESGHPPDVCPQCGATPDLFEIASATEEAAGQAVVCTVCGFTPDDGSPPDVCPQCGATPDLFEMQDAQPKAPTAPPATGAYLETWARADDDFERKFAHVRELAMHGKSEITPMRTQRLFPDWDDVLFRGVQLSRMPLNEDEPVNTKTVIGRTAGHPLELEMPFYVSHMSFGALSREAKTALARGSKLVGTAICSGEGGMLPVERDEADKYIYELGTAAFSHKDEAIRAGDAVEIKIGQAAKPGLGGHLPGRKVTPEVAEVRGLASGQDSISPGRYCRLNGPDDLKAEVARVRELTDGKPVGVKLAAGHVEADLEIALAAEPDFITVDCRGGGTGAAPRYIKDNVCVPPIFAVYRARKFLDDMSSPVTLCVTGGFRDSADIAKALAMGADAVALATASLIAIGCQQYRICHTGMCPVGITTQNPDLRARFNVEESTKRLVNFYTATNDELRAFARINGHDDVHGLCVSDLLTVNSEISDHTNIEHA
ncbi:MAG: hypothetical protein GWP08_13060 [Nitrospiraceae bacterium]|nr:hypothetical protein [Nitrospiraceae bacterium]